ncbi:MAG: dTDP-4-dehydrorhamnose reductase [Sarcina sp.]
MKILITGSNGQLGNELQDIIRKGYSEIGKVSEKVVSAEVIAVDVDKFNITNELQVKEFIIEEKPDVVINCAAYTNVDKCEECKNIAYEINAVGPKYLAQACEVIGAKFVQVSTDYVFEGTGNVPFTENSNLNPQSEYGRSKLDGEKFVSEFCTKHFIVRTAWLYGYVGNNFVYTMRNLGESKESLMVVDDQRGNPTHANDLAYHILRMIETETYGVYHCTGKGECSWYDFAAEIMRLSNLNCNVNPCTTEEFPRPAKRPEYSSLDNKMLRETIGDEMRAWKEALEIFVNKIQERENEQT